MVTSTTRWTPATTEWGRALLNLQGKLDRRELGSRARLPVEWIIGRHVLLDVELAPASASGRPGGEAA
jgi:hypothetical protein